MYMNFVLDICVILNFASSSKYHICLFVFFIFNEKVVRMLPIKAYMYDLIYIYGKMTFNPPTFRKKDKKPINISKRTYNSISVNKHSLF